MQPPSADPSTVSVRDAQTTERLNAYMQCNKQKRKKRRITGPCLGLGGEAGHERGGGVAGVVLLDEADRGVDEEQRDDPDEVLPVRRSPLHVGTNEITHVRVIHPH
jgi:hypothetical protein